ncbi:MAG: DUF6671 family protein [Bacteroidota bacterium]
MFLFKNRTLLIATKHKKEQVLAPLLERTLAVHCIPLTQFDTDSLGTFSGEVERENNPLTTLRNKCAFAAKAHGVDLVVGTEGSFGPHPVYGWLPAHDELVMLLDLKNNIEIFAREMSTQTNYGGTTVSTYDELFAFAKGKGFPEHALIIKDKTQEFSQCIKGIQQENELLAAFEKTKKYHQNVWVETDMRAHLNPTRMKVIEQAAGKLINHIQSECPQCKRPGFVVKKVIAGLPCSVCGTPTESIKSELKVCDGCRYEEELIYPKNKTTEDPMYCLVCNP